MDGRIFRLLALAAGLLMSLPWPGLSLIWVGLKLFVAAALLTFAVMPWVIRLAWREGAVDYPDARRVHARPTPRIGGLAVFFSVNLTLLLNFNYSLALKGVCLSAIFVAMISLLDDVREVAAASKLLVHVLATVLLFAFGVHVEFAPDALWGDGLEFALTLLWMVGITNAFNFLDGINGLAASLALVVTLLMGVLAWLTQQTYMLLLCLSVAGAALGFLPDNARYRRPARVFLGDVGSTYLGWMMAAIAVMGEWSAEGPIKAYTAPLLIFSVMIFDMIYTTIARISRGDVKNLREWIAFVGRDHLHHRLLQLGFRPFHTVVAIVALCLVSGLAALALVVPEQYYPWVLLAQAAVIYLGLSFAMVHANHQRGAANTR